MRYVKAFIILISFPLKPLDDICHPRRSYCFHILIQNEILIVILLSRITMHNLVRSRADFFFIRRYLNKIFDYSKNRVNRYKINLIEVG